jgi:predicted peptidase
MKALFQLIAKLNRYHVSDAHEITLLLRRYQAYLTAINSFNPLAINNIYAFQAMLQKLDDCVENVLAGRDMFYGMTGLLERAYISNLDQRLDSFIFFLPTTFNLQTAYPLIILLHGYGERCYLPYYSIAHNEFLLNCNRKNMIFVAPSGRHEPGCDAPSYVKGREDILQVIDIMTRSYRIIPEQIYLTGVSMGGHGTWYMASLYPELFAAIAPVCGYGRGEFSTPVIQLNNLLPLPIHIFHGDSDTVVHVDSSRIMAKELKGLGANVLYLEYPNVGHDSWDYAYRGPDLLDWFLTHRRAK